MWLTGSAVIQSLVDAVLAQAPLKPCPLESFGWIISKTIKGRCISVIITIGSNSVSTGSSPRDICDNAPGVTPKCLYYTIYNYTHCTRTRFLCYRTSEFENYLDIHFYRNDLSYNVFVNNLYKNNWNRRNHTRRVFWNLCVFPSYVLLSDI